MEFESNDSITLEKVGEIGQTKISNYLGKLGYGTQVGSFLSLANKIVKDKFVSEVCIFLCIRNLF